MTVLVLHQKDLEIEHFEISGQYFFLRRETLFKLSPISSNEKAADKDHEVFLL